LALGGTGSVTPGAHARGHGKPLDADFLSRLPSYVDPCGEQGEYHTFVYDGPMFQEPIKCRIGETVLRESLYFSDVIPE